MKPIEQLSESGLRKRRKHLMSMPLTPERTAQIRQIDQRLNDICHEDSDFLHPPTYIEVIAYMEAVESMGGDE